MSELDRAIDEVKGEVSEAAQKETAEQFEERFEAEKEFKEPQFWVDHPAAKVINQATDNLLSLPRGKSHECLWGESWASVIDYYGYIGDHPLMYLAAAGAQLAYFKLVEGKKKPKRPVTQSKGDAVTERRERDRWQPPGDREPTTNPDHREI